MSEWAPWYPAVHRVLAPAYRDLPIESVDAVVRAALGPSIGVAEAESFFNDLGRTLSQVGRAAAPIVGPALQGAVAGGASGAALGPYGALAGALLGGTAAAIGAAQAPRPAAPRPAAPVAPRAAAPAGFPAAPAVVPSAPAPSGGVPGVAGGPAVPQLIAALASPTVQDALAALLMGRAGAPTVAGAGGQALATPAILNMLGMLTAQAAGEAEAWETGGEGAGIAEGLEEADPEARAEWVFGRLAPPTVPGEALANGSGETEGWLDALYDELEAEFYAEAEPPGGWPDG